jgi:hypothetical protein
MLGWFCFSFNTDADKAKANNIKVANKAVALNAAIEADAANEANEAVKRPQQEVQLISILWNYVLLLCMYSWMVVASGVSLLYSWLAKYWVTGMLRGVCHRPWHYGGKHSLLNVAIC